MNRAPSTAPSAAQATAQATAPTPIVAPPAVQPSYAYNSPQISQVQITNSYSTRPSLSAQQSLGAQQYPLYSQQVSATPVKYPRYIAQIRGYSLSPTVSTDLAPDNEWYSDLGLGLLYQIDRHNTVGFELGNEAYPMVFEGDRNGQTLLYEQHPSTMWYGPTYRYTANTFGTLPIAPYGQVLLGFSEYGPVGRLAAGFQYAPSGTLSFILALESSALAYRHQDTWYVSPKIGLTYGMSVLF